MLIALQNFRIRQVLLVSLEDGGSVHNWVERGPFLEEDVDELVGHQARRGLDLPVDAGM